MLQARKSEEPAKIGKRTFIVARYTPFLRHNITDLREASVVFNVVPTTLQASERRLRVERRT
jgi:hypothetical protein